MADLIPIFGMVTGVLITGGLIFGFVRIMHSPVGIALARRLQGSVPVDDDLRQEVADLREQVEDVHRQLGETQERLDFTERLLTQTRQASQLPEVRN
jgi:hypothetical protein